MTFVTDHPELAVEALAAVVKAAGGALTISLEDWPGPFKMLFECETDDKGRAAKIHIMIDETGAPS